MKLHALRLTNFRQHVNTEIVFGSGITGIIGPNGAGKTTILEAVAFALYAWGRSTREQMLSITASGRQVMTVELEFELGRHRYRVVRGRNTAELYLDGEDTPIAVSSTAVTDRLQRLLGMSRDEFFRTYFTGQKELALMAAMGASERARFLSKVLGYEKLRLAQDMTLEMIRPKWEQAQQNREKVQSISVEIGSGEREEVSHRRNLERVASELAMVAQSRAELSRLQRSLEPMGELRDELSILDEMYREEGRRKTLVENEVSQREELDKLRARHAAIEKAPAQEEEVTVELWQVPSVAHPGQYCRTLRFLSI